MFFRSLQVRRETQVSSSLFPIADRSFILVKRNSSHSISSPIKSHPDTITGKPMKKHPQSIHAFKKTRGGHSKTKITKKIPNNSINCKIAPSLECGSTDHPYGWGMF